MNYNEIMDSFIEEMIDVCLEFATCAVDKIYLYCCNETRMASAGCFFDCNTQLLHIHQLNQLNQLSDLINVSSDNVFGFLKRLQNRLLEYRRSCKSSSYEMPTEIKIIHNCRTGENDIKFKYNTQISSEAPIKGPHEIFESWFEGVKTEYETK